MVFREIAEQKFIFRQGGDVEIRGTLREKDTGNVIDLTNYKAQMDIRESTESSTAFLSLDSEGNGIVLSASSPNITITITNAQTSNFESKRYVTDFRLENPSGELDYVFKGPVIPEETVTR